jgi:hypothetical protein
MEVGRWKFSVVIENLRKEVGSLEFDIYIEVEF